jgi:FkbM family methyltransferase
MATQDLVTRSGDMQHLARRTIKPFVPSGIWRSARNQWNHARYAWFWKHRQVVSFNRGDERISFVIVNRNDSIQSEQASGRFYEEDDLSEIASYFPEGGVFVDIGANTGQHSIYVARLLGASRLILFEPIPESCKILKENLRLNCLTEISDISHLGVGLSDRVGRTTFTTDLFNLGGTSLIDDQKGSIETTTGDAVLSSERVDFIKIDTEGFEIKVLNGLVRTIQRERPSIFLEVDDRNAEEFMSFVTGHNYEIAFSSRRYPLNQNFLVTPKKSGAGRLAEGHRL